MNCDGGGGKWREVSQAVVSHAFKGAISHAAVKTALILFFPYTGHLLYLLMKSSISQPSGSASCVSAISNQCVVMLACTGRGALQMLLSLTVKNREGQPILFLLEKYMQLSTSITSEM